MLLVTPVLGVLRAAYGTLGKSGPWAVVLLIAVLLFGGAIAIGDAVDGPDVAPTTDALPAVGAVECVTTERLYADGSSEVNNYGPCPTATNEAPATATATVPYYGPPTATAPLTADECAAGHILDTDGRCAPVVASIGSTLIPPGLACAEDEVIAFVGPDALACVHVETVICEVLNERIAAQIETGQGVIAGGPLDMFVFDLCGVPNATAPATATPERVGAIAGLPIPNGLRCGDGQIVAPVAGVVQCREEQALFCDLLEQSLASHLAHMPDPTGRVAPAMLDYATGLCGMVVGPGALSGPGS